MATATVSAVSSLDQETAEALEEMATASTEIANVLAIAVAHGGAKWAPVDGRLGRLLASIQRQFTRFAGATSVSDQRTLRTLARIYEDVAGALYELANTADGPRAARVLACTIASHSARISDIVELAPRRN